MTLLVIGLDLDARTVQDVLRDMTAPDGGFYSAEDADSEGEEGKYYVWSPQELQESVGREEAALAEHCEYETRLSLRRFWPGRLGEAS